MKISSKGRYAVRTMAMLAKNKDKVMSVTDIASNQSFSVKYLERVISLLQKNHLITSSRGAMGGYCLAKNPKDISVAQILDITGDLPHFAPCLEGNMSCPIKTKCDSIGVWEKLNKMIVDYLSQISLQDLVDKKV